MSLSKKISRMGLFKGEGGDVPIYGIDTMELAKESEWNTLGVGVQSATIAIWKGDKPVRYNFNFTIVAGIGEVDSRQELYNKMKLMHSWAAHVEGGGGGKAKINSPVVVQLVVPGYINCSGVIERIVTGASGPWDSDSSVRYPTKCSFSGSFLMLPGYDGKGVNIVKQATKLSSSQVRSSFYRG